MQEQTFMFIFAQKIFRQMKKNLLIELLETGEKVLEKKKIITIIGTNLNGPLEITINTDN